LNLNLDKFSFDVFGILLIITAVFLLIQIFFLVRMLRFRPIRFENKDPLPPVSVVICGRNAADNWTKLLPKLLEQDYPNFEIVAVNDRSWDHSEDVLEAFAKESTRIRLVRVQESENFFNGKKFALTLGIKAAKHDQILLTDSDCIPSSKNWLRNMVSGFNEAEIILGYGDYFPQKGLLNAFIRWETLQTALMGFSAAAAGRTYMAVGRNLAYTRELFYDRKGFYDHMHLPMGDDDLFVNHAAPFASVTWAAHPEAKTLSIPKQNFTDWWNQKRRHLQASKYYRRSSKFMLGVYGLSKAGLMLGIIALAFSPFMLLCLVMFVIYMTLLSIASWRFSKFWNLGAIGLLGPWLDLILIHIQGMAMIANFFRWKKPTW